MDRLRMALNLERLKANLESIRHRIGAACDRADRDPATVALVAVTKASSDELVTALASLGLFAFGENRMPAATERADRFPALAWHYIGRLQRNKVNKAVGRFALIHSVDSIPLAEAIARRATEQGAEQAILLQVNTSGEATKQGFEPGEAVEAARTVGALSGLRLAGLMTMAPWGAEPEACRTYFGRLGDLAVEVEQASGQALPERSIGMSSDFEVAVECGATLVRIGRGLVEGVSEPGGET